MAITIQPKPGLWAANAASVDPYWQEYWQDLFVFLPYQGVPGTVVDKGQMASHGRSNIWDDQGGGQNLPRWAGTANADWVLGEVGPGIKGNLSIGFEQGVKVTDDGRQFRLNGITRPMAFALLFEFDGLDVADQRALVSQGGFRCRIGASGSSPHNFEGTSPRISNCIYDDELTLLVVWSDTTNNADDDYNMAIFNLTDAHPDIREFAFNVRLAGTAGISSELFVGTQSSNDPGEGLTIYGFWAWSPPPTTTINYNQWWTTQKVEKFAEDPFGMYRRVAVPTITAVTPSLVIRPNQYGAKIAM